MYYVRRPGSATHHTSYQTQALCQALVHLCLSPSVLTAVLLCNLTLPLSITQAEFCGHKCFPAFLRLVFAMLLSIATR